LKFYTRDKKPKVYSIAMLTATAALLLFAVVHTAPELLLSYGNLILTAYFAGIVIILLNAFQKQLQYNPYSYNTIFYPGFALFICSLLGTHAYITVQCFRDPDSYRAAQMLFTLVHSAKNYMFLTTPFLLLLSLSLFISNIALIRHEGRRFVNVLGILLSVMILTGEVLVALLDVWSSFSGLGNLLQNMVVNLLAAFYLYFECMIIGSVIADLIAARYHADPDRDYLLVLGCGLKKDGTPTPLLRGRLDLALKFDEEQQAAAGKKAVFIVSGGQGPDEVCSEAASMRDYLLRQGIPEERILSEDRSTDTTENMRFSSRLLGEAAKDAAIAFFTTNYHVFRAGLKSRQAGMHAVGMGAPTKWYFWPNAAVREFVGLLTEHRGKQALLLTGIAVVYAVLTVLVYL
jgi:uncharacterized SAM-binding protein YcdF (DUF218 family)